MAALKSRRRRAVASSRAAADGDRCFSVFIARPRNRLASDETFTMRAGELRFKVSRRRFGPLTVAVPLGRCTIPRGRASRRAALIWLGRPGAPGSPSQGPARPSLARSNSDSDHLVVVARNAADSDLTANEPRSHAFAVPVHANRARRNRHSASSHVSPTRFLPNRSWGSAFLSWYPARA
jgi:hypothetical protein